MSVSPTVELDPTSGMPRNPSRFQVNRVDGGSDSPDATPRTPDGTEDNNVAPTINKASDENVQPEYHGKQVQFSVGVKNSADDQPDHNMGTVNYGTTNLKSFRNVQTLDRLPHHDHYRNIMSVEGAMAVRPSLMELHDEAADSKPSGEIIDMKHFIIQDVRKFVATV